MAQTTITNSVPLTNTYYQISAPNKSGQIIIDIDESNYDTIKNYVGGIVFHFFIKIDEQYIPIRDRTYIWNSGSDLSIEVQEIPTDCYVLVSPIIDNDNVIVLMSGLPISLVFDDTAIPVPGGSGGKGNADGVVTNNLVSLFNPTITGVI